MDFETRKRLEALEGGSGSVLARSPFNYNDRPRLLTGSLAEKLTPAHPKAKFNVLLEPVNGEGPENSDFKPVQVDVYYFERWAPVPVPSGPSFGGGGPAQKVGWKSGTNGSAHWVDNFRCYVFIADCGTGSPGEDYPSSPSGPSDGGDPDITVSPSSLDVSSGAQSYEVSWTNLTANIEITKSGPNESYFELSQTGSGSGYADSQSVSFGSGSGSITIWVRKKVDVFPLSGTYTATAENASTGATTENVSLTYIEP